MDKQTANRFQWLRRTRPQSTTVPTQTLTGQSGNLETGLPPASLPMQIPEDNITLPQYSPQERQASATENGSRLTPVPLGRKSILQLEYRWVPAHELCYTTLDGTTNVQHSTMNDIPAPDQEDMLKHIGDAQYTHIEDYLSAHGMKDALLARALPDGTLDVIAEISGGILYTPTRPEADHHSTSQLIPCVVLDIQPEEAHALAIAIQTRLAPPRLTPDSTPNTTGDEPHSRRKQGSRTKRPSSARKARAPLSDNSADDEDDTEETHHTGNQRQKIGKSQFRVFSQEDILHTAFTHFRNQGFPYRVLPPFISKQRINKLSQTPPDRLLNTLTGLDVADTYHPHRHQVHGPHAPSSYDAFYDDKLLRRALLLRLQDNGRLTEDYPSTLNLVTHSSTGSNFRPGFAMYLYQHYCVPGSIVLDCATGFGGRLVGFLASGIADPHRDPEDTGRYIGFDPNTLTHAGNVRLAQDLGFAANVDLFNLPIEDALEQIDQLHLRERCDFALTSPPYFNKEHYSDEPTQSDMRYTTPQAWRTGFLVPFLRFTAQSLKPGAHALVNIDDIQIRNVFLPLIDWTRDAANDVGLTYIESITFRLRTSMGTGINSKTIDHEPVLVFQKPYPGDGSPTSLDTLRAVHSPAHLLSPHSTTAAALPEVPSTSQATKSPSSPRAKASPAAQNPDLHYDTTSLQYWMSRLYARTADERTIVSRMGVWPVELAPYITALCRCHSSEKYGDPPEVSFAPGLLRWDDYRKKPIRPRTCLLLFSGGKDSLAAGMLAEQAGYRVVAVTLSKINRSFPYEIIRARTMARLMGWEHRLLQPDHLPVGTLGESVIKNQYSLAFALAMLEFIPEAFAFGSYRIEDCWTTSWFSDMDISFRTFDLALQTMQLDSQEEKPGYHPQESFVSTWLGYPRRLPPVLDPRESYQIWKDAPPLVRELTASCMMPPRYKDKLHEYYTSRGVPLSDYQCGACEKCLAQAALLHYQLDWPMSSDTSVPTDTPWPATSQTLAVIQALLNQVQGNPSDFDRELMSAFLAHTILSPLRSAATGRCFGQPYPAFYLEHACKRLGSLFTLPLWCHVHPSLETTAVAPGQSHQYLWDYTYGGHLTPRRIHRSQNELAKRQDIVPAREPIVTFL